MDQLAQNYTVPTYEEVIMSGQYPISQTSERHNSVTQLPAYEELEEGLNTVDDGSSPSRRPSSQIDPSTGAGGRRNSRPGRKLIPLKIRRIRSDNLRRKSLGDIQQSNVFTIEPLTPPPQYDDKVPPLPPNTQEWIRAADLHWRCSVKVWWSVHLLYEILQHWTANCSSGYVPLSEAQSSVKVESLQDVFLCWLYISCLEKKPLRKKMFAAD